jgi:trans-aconitate methyltransferase
VARSAPTSIPTAHFDRLYERERDPWGTLDKPCEREKFADTLAMLPPGRFACCLDIGCGTGALTRLLARRCDTVLAVDCSAAALAQAADTCADLGNVTLRRMRIPDTLSVPPADLVVLSETGYYLTAADLERTAHRIAGGLRPGGHLLLAHCVKESEHHLLSTRDVHDTFRREPALRPVRGKEVQRPDGAYRLELLVRV